MCLRQKDTVRSAQYVKRILRVSCVRASFVISDGHFTGRKVAKCVRQLAVAQQRTTTQHSEINKIRAATIPVSQHEQAGSHQVEGHENPRADDRVERVEGDQ